VNQAILAWSFKIFCRQLLTLYLGHLVPWDIFFTFSATGRFLGRFVPWDVLCRGTFCAVGRFVPWDVLCRGTFCAWDVLRVGRFESGTF
jgi:hypothetical protein